MATETWHRWMVNDGDVSDVSDVILYGGYWWMTGGYWWMTGGYWWMTGGYWWMTGGYWWMTGTAG